MNHRVVRRASAGDVSEINNFFNRSGGTPVLKQAFGSFSANALLETAYLTLLITDPKFAPEESQNSDAPLAKDPKILGCLCINDNTSLSGDAGTFESKIDELNEYLPVTRNNTLFLNFWSLEEPTKGIDRDAIEMVKEAFSICPEIDFIIYMAPKNCLPTVFMDEHFDQIEPPKRLDGANMPPLFEANKWYFMHRSKFLQRLSVRQARAEDNDELIPILRRTDPEILEGQNSYFISDLVESPDEMSKFFVGLQGEVVVGMLATSLDVNVQLIGRVFEIDSLDNMIHQEPERPPPPPTIIAVMGDLRLVSIDVIREALGSANVVFANLETLEKVISTTPRTPLWEEEKDDVTVESKEEDRKEESGREEGMPLRTVCSFVETFQALLPSQQGVISDAIVLFGFTRGQEQLDDVRDFLGVVDCILEVVHPSDDMTDDEEDEFLNHHLHGVELCRNLYEDMAVEEDASLGSPDHSQGGQSLGGRGAEQAQWTKVHASSEDRQSNALEVIESIDDILRARNASIQLDREKANSDPNFNAFVVTMFSMEEAFISRSEDLLKLAFEEHPNFDYCLFMIPNGRPPTRLTRCFSYVPTKAGLSYDQTLYAVHRSAFLAKEHIKVTRMDKSHYDALDDYISPLPERQREDITLSAQKSLRENDIDLQDNPSDVTLVITIKDIVVGVVQVSRKMLTAEDSSWMRANYKVDDVVNIERHKIRNQCAVTQWVLNPIYSKWSRFILRDVMRMYCKTVLFYNTTDVSPPSREILHEFIHVCPRRRQQRSGDGGAPMELIERPSKVIGAHGNDAPLYCISKGNLATPKDIIFKRIAVVGGSSHSYAILETLCFVPNLYFANVYIIVDKAPTPFLSEEEDNGEESKFNDDYSGCFSRKSMEYPTEKDLFAMGLVHKTNIIIGNLTDIDRVSRAVVINDEMVLEYDVLLISSNTQDNFSKTLPSISRMHPSACADAGIFALGNPAADIVALRWAKKRSASSEPFVIHGIYIDAMAAAARLLACGVQPKRIVVVIPDEPMTIEEVDDKAITDKLAGIAAESGLKVYWGQKLKDVSLKNGFIDRCMVISKHKEEISIEESKNESKGVNIPCTALFLCMNRQCTRDVFSAVNDAGLVFDGGMVVNEAFTTVDPHIYAVSDFTRFSKVFAEASFSHARYNSRELGLYVAMKVLEYHLDPQSVHFFDQPVSLTPVRCPRPLFGLSRSYMADLPGLTFFRSKLPVVPEEVVSFPTAITIPNRLGGTTGRNVTLKLADYGIINEVVYVGEEPIEGRNLAQIPGNHESFLNSAVYTYEKGYIEDWIMFFRGAWANVVYHDKFPVLVQSFRDCLRTDKGMLMIMEKVLGQAEELTLDNPEDIMKYRRELIGPLCENLDKTTLNTISTVSIDFVKMHKAVLNLYYIPSHVQAAVGESK